jgi:hypothetical protein
MWAARGRRGSARLVAQGSDGLRHDSPDVHRCQRPSGHLDPHGRPVDRLRRSGWDDGGARSMGLYRPRAMTGSAHSRVVPRQQPLRGRALAQVIAGMIVAGPALAACNPLAQAPSTHGPTAAPGGISHEAAITKARDVAPGSGPSTTVVWASIESDPFAPRGTAPPGPLVWIVRLQGRLQVSPCPSGFLDRPAALSDGACLDRDGGINVVLDYVSGDLLGWTH